jgi:hypothetical protein
MGRNLFVLQTLFFYFLVENIFIFTKKGMTLKNYNGMLTKQLLFWYEMVIVIASDMVASNKIMIEEEVILSPYQIGV